MPYIDPAHEQYTQEEQRAYYKEKGIVFLEDEWSLWHIRVWIHARTSAGFGVQVNPAVVFAYALKWGMDEIETLELVQQIEESSDDGKKA